MLPEDVCERLGLTFEPTRRKVRYADGRIASAVVGNPPGNRRPGDDQTLCRGRRPCRSSARFR